MFIPVIVFLRVKRKEIAMAVAIINVNIIIILLLLTIVNVINMKPFFLGMLSNYILDK